MTKKINRKGTTGTFNNNRTLIGSLAKNTKRTEGATDKEHDISLSDKLIPFCDSDQLVAVA